MSGSGGETVRRLLKLGAVAGRGGSAITVTRSSDADRREACLPWRDPSGARSLSIRAGRCSWCAERKMDKRIAHTLKTSARTDCDGRGKGPPAISFCRGAGTDGGRPRWCPTVRTISSPAGDSGAPRTGAGRRIENMFSRTAVFDRLGFRLCACDGGFMASAICCHETGTGQRLVLVSAPRTRRRAVVQAAVQPCEVPRLSAPIFSWRLLGRKSQAAGRTWCFALVHRHLVMPRRWCALPQRESLTQQVAYFSQAGKGAHAAILPHRRRTTWTLSPPRLPAKGCCGHLRCMSTSTACHIGMLTSWIASPISSAISSMPYCHLLTGPAGVWKPCLDSLLAPALVVQAVGARRPRLLLPASAVGDMHTKVVLSRCEEGLARCVLRLQPPCVGRSAEGGAFD